MWTVTDAFVDSPEQETKELARGLRDRDPEVLDRLIDRFQYRLFRYLLYLSGSRDTAEDLFQETWIRILEKGHLYNGRSRFETWLFAIARNLFIDLVRSTRTPMSLEQLMDPEVRTLDLPASAALLPAEQVLREEESRRIAAALGSLPVLYREVLVLRFQEDLALDEIAAVVAAPLSTVKSRLYRGLELLRDALEEGKS
jgi:RNA polymerase sigma-70 factor (ECF subfamily)